MSHYCIEDRVFIIKTFYQEKYPKNVQRKWKLVKKSDPPKRETITKMIKKFEATGSVLDDVSKRGRPKIRTSEENQEKIINLINLDPTSSSRRLSSVLNLSQSSVNRITKKALLLKPYRPRLIHQLSEDDYDRRVEFSERFIAMHDADPKLIDSIWWSDESSFNLAGEVNRHNCVYYATENPNVTIIKPIKSPSLTVWAAISSIGLIGPYFFEGTVTGQNYLQMLKTFFIRKIKARDKYHFMQDGAPPHYAKDVRSWLDNKFPERWIGRRGPIDWPPRSPDMTPLDFYLWGYLKHVIYGKEAKNLEELKENIINAFAEVQIENIQKACRSVLDRCSRCLDAEGRQFEHLT